MPTALHGAPRPARALLLGTVAAASLAACTSVPRAVPPAPIAFACASLTPPAFASRGLALLRENNWNVREADSTRGLVRGTRGPIFAGLGENLTVDGPYLLSTTHDGREARVLAQVIETHEHRVIPVQNLGDASNEADLRNVLPVIDGLRAACGVPTSGRQPARPPAPQLPPPHGGAGQQ